MPNELNIALATTGLTVTAQRFQAGAAVGSAISCPETGSTGFYSGNMTGTAGTYQVAFLAAGANVGSGSIVWDGSAEVATSTLTQANVQSALTSQGLTTARAGNLDNLDAAVSSRLAPSGTLATVTNLTNAPTSVTPSDIWSHATRTLTSASGPTAVQIRQEMDSNSTKLANLDATVSSRLAASSYTAPSTPPTAAAIADEVRVELATELAKLDAPVSGATAPSASTVASAIRTELATELSRMDVSVSSRLAASESTKLDAVKAKTDALNTERLANVATTAIVGNLIAQANS